MRYEIWLVTHTRKGAKTDNGDVVWKTLEHERFWKAAGDNLSKAEAERTRLSQAISREQGEFIIKEYAEVTGGTQMAAQRSFNNGEGQTR